MTGADGFIGSHIVGELLRRGYRVRASVWDPSESNTAHLSQLARDEDATDRIEFVGGDLLKEGSYDDVVAGCEGVFHVAAIVAVSARDPQTEIVDPSISGTLNVLRSCGKAGSVRRVVHTSSIAATYSFDLPGPATFSEDDWNTAATVKTDPYALGKVLAEEAAIEYVDGLPPARGLSLVHVNPALCLGPPLVPRHCHGSLQLVAKLLGGKVPGVPRFTAAVVDVRDAALAHVEAMVRETVSPRYIVAAQTLWYPEIAARLAALYPDLGVPTRTLPKPVVLLAALFDEDLAFHQMRRILNKDYRWDGGLATRELGVQYRDLDVMLRTATDALVRFGV